MKKSNFKSSGSCGQLLPLPAESQDGRFWPCHRDPQCAVRDPRDPEPLGRSLCCPPSMALLLVRAVTVAEVKSHKTSSERITLLLYPACVPLGSWVQPLMWLQGLSSPVWSQQAVEGHSLAQLCPAAVSSGTGTLLLAWFFRAMTADTVNVLRTWKGHRILADDLIDHTPSLPPCRVHFHT